MDRHSTAVVLRPVPPECPVTAPFEQDRRGVTFDCLPRTFALASASGVVTEAGRGSVSVYCELPNLTVILTYDNLRSTHVRKGQKVKEGDPVGSPRDRLRFTAVHLPSHAPVEPEFFSDYRIPGQ